MTTDRLDTPDTKHKTPPEAAGEVRRYLIRLVGLILLGLLIMTSVATWAWFKYGSRLDDSVRRAPVPDSQSDY